MKSTIVALLLVSFLFPTFIFSQSVLKGVITFQNSGSQPAAGVSVNAFGANTVYTTDAGMFEITFFTKKAGDKIKLSIGQNDKKGINLQVVNDKVLESIRIPSKPEDDIIDVAVCKAGKRDEEAMRYYGILIKAADEKLNKKVDEIQKKLNEKNIDEKNIDEKTTSILVREIEKLRIENEEVKKKAEEQALFIASINKDNSSQMVKDAINAIDSLKSIEAALKILDTEKLYKAYKQAKDKKEKAETEIEQVLEGLVLRFKLLFTEFSKVDELNSLIDMIYEVSNSCSNTNSEFYMTKVQKIQFKFAVAGISSIIQVKDSDKYLIDALNDLEHDDDVLKSKETSVYIKIAMILLVKYGHNSNKKISTKVKSLVNRYSELNSDIETNITLIYFYKLLNTKEDSLKALRIYKKTDSLASNNKYDEITILESIATLYKRFNEFEKSLKYYNLCLQNPNYDIMAFNNKLKILENVFKLYKSYQDNKNIEITMKKMEELCYANRNTNNSSLLYEIAQFYNDYQHNDTLALVYYNKSINARALDNDFLDNSHIIPAMIEACSIIIYKRSDTTNFDIALRYAEIMKQAKAIDFVELSLEELKSEFGINDLREIPDMIIALISLNKAKLFKSLNRYADAIFEIEKAFTIIINQHKESEIIDPDIYNALGLFYYNAREYEKSINYFEKYKKYSAVIQNTYFNYIGAAFLKSKKIKEAEKIFTECGKKFPNEGATYWNWAMYYALQNDKSKAIENLKKAVKFGYQDLEWITTDVSIESIREEPEYKQIVEKLQKKEKK